MMSKWQRFPKSVWWALGSLVPMAVGAFGPWVTVEGLTIHGTDDGRDGWVVVGAAAVAGLALVFFLRFPRGWLAVITLLAALAGVGTTAYDIQDINGFASGSLLFAEVDVSAEWGIYVALVGSISLALASIGLLVEGRRRKPAAVEAPTGA
jgi:hypothetical protein